MPVGAALNGSLTVAALSREDARTEALVARAAVGSLSGGNFPRAADETYLWDRASFAPLGSRPRALRSSPQTQRPQGPLGIAFAAPGQTVGVAFARANETRN